MTNTGREKLIFRPPESFLPDTECTLVLVDYSNLLYRSWFASKEQPWVAYCKFFDMLRLCIHKSKQPGVPIKIIFAGESRKKLRRLDIFEGYKANRVINKNLNFSDFRNKMSEIIKSLGWDIIQIDGAEADDVIASIVNTKCHRCYCTVKCENCDCAKKYKTDVVIFSGDRDLQQLLAWDRVWLYRAPGCFVGRDRFEEEYGIPVAKYGVYKALVGDKSDNIAGVFGFGPVSARTAINADSVACDIWELGGSEASEQFKLALKLVNLDTRLELYLDDLYDGPPILDNLKIDVDRSDAIIFEIKRLKEEFM